MERVISVRPTKITERSKWTTFKAGPKCSGWTKPKWCVPFDVTTEISVVLGWVESAHNALDPCQCQQAVNSLLFSLWWCTMQPAIVVKFLGRQNLLYSWFCYYFYPLRKIERCRSSPLWFAQTPWWLHEKTNSHTPKKRPAMLMSKTCFNITDLFIPLLIISFSLVTFYVWLSSDVMRRN